MIPFLIVDFEGVCGATFSDIQRNFFPNFWSPNCEAIPSFFSFSLFDVMIFWVMLLELHIWLIGFNLSLAIPEVPLMNLCISIVMPLSSLYPIIVSPHIFLLVS